MKTLYLVRHAKAEIFTKDAQDELRPLTAHGEAVATMMGKRLEQQMIKPQLIMSSPAVRTLHTAELIAVELNIAIADIVKDPKIYNASLNTLLKVIYDLDFQYERVMLVGHNPGMTQAANHLGDHPIHHMPTCGIYGVVFDTDNWQNVSSEIATNTFYDYPKK